MVAGRLGMVAVLVAAAAAPLAAAGRGAGGTEGGPAVARTPVVLTTDCGTEVDDQWALAHLALSPQIDLRGVVTTHAPNLTSEASAREARDVLSRLRLRRPPPVLAGSGKPLADRTRPRRNAGVDFLLRQAAGFGPERRLRVLVIGAATDVASALLVEPTVARRIDVVAMAFNEWPAGTDPWNVKNDVRAWQVLIDADAPLTVGDAAVTRRHLSLTRERARAVAGRHGPAGRFLADLVVNWLGRNGNLAKELAGRDDAWPIWDEVTTAHLLGLTESAVRPRPRLADDTRFLHAPPGRPTGRTVRWVTRIDADRLWADLGRKLDRAAREAAGGK